MAINLQSKTLKKLVDQWAVSSVVAGKSTNAYEWDGVKSIKLLSIETEELNNYSRSGTNRYGTPTDVQDVEQILPVEQDKAFSKVIDKGDNSEQFMLKSAGKVVNTIIKIRAIPMQDKYCINKWCAGAGEKIVVTAPLTKTNIVETIFKANELCVDNGVPFDNIYLYLPSDKYTAVRLAPEFIGVDKLAEKSLTKGEVGEIADFRVVKVPKSYFPTGVEFLVAHKEAVVAPKKINDTSIHENPPGINGHLIEGRFLFDAHVIKTKDVGAIVCGTQTALDGLVTLRATRSALDDNAIEKIKALAKAEALAEAKAKAEEEAKAEAEAKEKAKKA